MTELIMLIIALFISILYATRMILVSIHSDNATKIIFSRDNWNELLNKYKPANNYIKNWIDIRKWTLNQMFPGLKTK